MKLCYFSSLTKSGTSVFTANLKHIPALRGSDVTLTQAQVKLSWASVNQNVHYKRDGIRGKVMLNLHDKQVCSTVFAHKHVSTSP